MINIDKASSNPLYEQIMVSVKRQIIDGILSPGDRLPSVREMANSLMINPNTISRAYKLLEEENIIITIHGKGTFIKDVSVNQQDSETTARIKKDLEILLVDAYYANIDKKDILDWVTNFSISMEGL